MNVIFAKYHYMQHFYVVKKEEQFALKSGIQPFI